MAKETTKQELIRLIDELTAAVFGTAPNGRAVASICRDLHEIGTSEEGRAAGYSRPYSWLVEWRAFSVGKPSEAEQERRRLADSGWASSTPEDKRRATMQAKADQAAREYEAARKARLAAESAEFNKGHEPLRRKAVA